MSVVIKNIGEFHGQLAAWIESVKQATSDVTMGLAHEAFDRILANSPQNSGDFVANTIVEVGGVTPQFEAYAIPGVKPDQFKVGDEPAQAHARSKANWTPGQPGQAVFIHNSAEHDDAYAVDLENGVINLREVNQGHAHMYHEAVMHTSHLYKHIGKSQMATLKRKTK